MLDMVEV